MRTLIVGGIEIPLRASLTLTQTYEPQQAVTRLRMADGSLVQQISWRDKLLTSIDGSGTIPAGLHLIDFTSPVVIKCVAERVVTSASNVIDIPSARRTDYPPEGRALLNGKWQSTPVVMSVDEATLTIVTGATQYQCIYWPEITCYCDPPKETRGVRNADYGWMITGEQV
jgi:hypothetical protein